MDINWNEINLIIQEKSGKSSYMVIPDEMEKSDLVKINFLLSEITKFPDNQKTVVDSGALFRKYLSEKYCELSQDSIDRLVYRFCYLNK